jgi:hypothetical protein
MIVMYHKFGYELTVLKANRFKDGMHREDQTYTAMAKQLVYRLRWQPANLERKITTPVQLLFVKKCINRY